MDDAAPSGRGSLVAEAPYLLGLVAVFLVAFFTLLALWLPISLLMGWRLTAITSGSMAPALRVGDVVALADPPEDLGDGAIVRFPAPFGDGHVVHRVVERTSTGYITRGDANVTADSTVVPTDQVEGVAVLVVPLVGVPVTLAAQSRWSALLVLAGVAALAVWATRFATDPAFDPWLRSAGSTWNPGGVLEPTVRGGLRMPLTARGLSAFEPPVSADLLPEPVMARLCDPAGVSPW